MNKDLMIAESTTTYFYNTRNLFVAGDFHAYSTQALHLALALNEKLSSVLSYFHALEKFPTVMREMLFPYAALGDDELEILNELRENAHAKGKSFLEQTLGEASEKLRLKVDFARDSLAKSIMHSASEANADLMFCGAYGTKPHTTGSIGSMAATFVAYTRIPLYLVKDPMQRTQHKRILVAFLESELSAELLAWAVSFALHHPGSDVEIVTPVLDLRACDKHGDYSSLAISEKQIRIAHERTNERAKIAVQTLSVPFSYEERARSFSLRQHAPVLPPAQAVLTVAEKMGADLIVLPTSQPTLMPENDIREITRSITEYANQNCLIIPEAFLKNKS